MPNALYPPLKPRSFADLLEAVIQLFRLSLLKCLPYATVAIVAAQLWMLYYLSHGQKPVLDGNDPVGVTLYGVGTLIGVILSVTILLRQSAMAAGRPVTGSTCLLETLKRAPAIVAIALLGGAVLTMLMLPALALAPAYRTAAAAVMMVPAIYVLIALSFSLPALVLARKGVLASLAYSFRLVRGNWWRVAFVYIVGAMIIMTFVLLVAAVTTLAQADNGPDDAAITHAITFAASLAVSALGLTFWSALSLTLFGDLEVRRMTSRPD